MHDSNVAVQRTWTDHIIFICFALAALMVVPAVRAMGQTDTGAIVGVVQDQSNAHVPGATVIVTDTATGVAHTYVTNGEGEYEALQLIPGPYKVAVSRSGFATAVRQNVNVQVQGRNQVDFVIGISAVQQNVVVNESTAVLQTQSAEVSQVLDSQQVNDLPLNGRDYDNLVLTEPGIFRDNSVSNPAEGLFSSNGNLQLQNYFQLDGIDNNSKSENLQEQSTQSVIPPPDALQEVAVQTRTYSVEFGTSAGAVINASTKSGTNHFHGDAWDYIQNGAMNANTWFNDYNHVAKGVYNQNQFGGTFGGPIRRNRTFFFVSYENLLSNIASTIESIVPTAAMKNGDFSAATNGSYMAAANRTMTPLVPSQAGCITGNVVAKRCFDSVGKAVLDLYPDPSPQLGNVNVFTGAANYVYSQTVPTDTRTLDVRVDHTLNQKNQIFGRYAFDYSNYITPSPWTSNPIAGDGSGFPTHYILHDQSVALGWTYTPNNSVVNTAHIGFLRTYSHSDQPGLQDGVSDAVSAIGLQGVPQNPENIGIPPFEESGLNSIGSEYYRPQYQVAQTYQLLDALYWLKGKHSFQFGYEFHQDALNFFDIEAPQGLIYNSGIFTNTSGFSGGDLLLGNVSQLVVESPDEINNYVRGNSFYAQDTWRPTRNLTVNYGVRYELYPPFWLNREGRTANFSCGPEAYPACIASGPPANGGTMVSAVSGDGWSGDTQMHTNHNDFAPRLGVIYHVFRPLVLRGGFGVFHQFINRIGSESMLQQNPPFLGTFQLAQQAGSTTPVFELGSPTGMNSSAYLNPTTLANLLTPGPTPGGLPTQHVRVQGVNNRTSYVEQASFGPQLQISSNTILSLNYIGNWGRKMNRVQNANQGFVVSCPTCATVTPAADIYFPLTSFNSGNVNPPGYPPNSNYSVNGAGQHAFVEMATNDGNTDYNALELYLQRQMTHRLGYTFAYTWSHNMADFVDNLTGGDTPQNAHDYGHEMSNSEQDVRHRFVATGTYNLPIGRGGYIMNNDSVGSRIVGGWTLNAIVSAQTGEPFNVSATNVSDTGGNSNSYANCVGDPWTGASKNPHVYAGVHSSGFFINPAAFSAPTLGNFGSCRPRIIHGPGLSDADLSLFKSFPVVREYRVEFRLEAFNALNHPSFANPSANISTSGANFGKVTSTTVAPRTMQVAVKLFF